MEQIFSQLQGILVQALPAFFLVLLLHFYLKKVLFQPLERVLAERSKRTEGKVEESEREVRRAAEKMRQYEVALAEARATIYKEIEEQRAALAASQSAALSLARDEAAVQIAAARDEIAREAQAARGALASEAERLAEQIATALLAGGRR